MTTANLMNVSSVKNGFTAQIDSSKKLQEENLEVAEAFAGFMNASMNLPNQVAEDSASNLVAKADSVQSPTDSYERYSYKENKIDVADEKNVSEKVEEAEETLEQTESEIVDVIADEYGVTEEEITELLDQMGLSVLDLLNPQNLVNFIVQLTGVASGEELLMDESFLSVMETLDYLAEGLMKEFNVDMEGLQELVAQMDFVEEELPVSFEENLENVMNGSVENVEETVQNAETNMAEVSMLETEVETEIGVEIEAEIVKEDVNIKNNMSSEETGNSVSLNQEVEEKTPFAENQSSEGNSLLNHQSNPNETVVTQQNAVNTNITSEVSSASFTSYMSADTVQIMEQIVNQMRVTISAEKTSMEMQLNPENLGKVYVNISTEEGIVNAHFRATNEVVKEALETQIATLRENLSQAGVKVDAIEVTIASHEFERNLEQNQQNPEENLESQENKTTKRRNLSVDSLDELSGIMTEEETLVAQIMKDNGNSVDFTA